MILTDSAERILKLRYYQEGEDWDKLCNRVCSFVADVEKTDEMKSYWSKRFYNSLYNLEIMPNSPTLKNAGTINPMLAACFVLIPMDSRESIFDTLKYAAMVQSRGGGTGFNFSTLRPSNSKILGVGGKTQGPISFMKIYDVAIGETIRQAGLREGAMMATFDYRHPDILKFITCKQTEQDLTHFNVSVLLTSGFFEAYKNNDYIDLWFPDYENYDKYDEEWDGDFDGWAEADKPIKIYQKIRASVIFDKIVENAWMNGEPGIIFKDQMNKTPHPKGTTIISTNPCIYKDTIMFNNNNLCKISNNNDISTWNSWKTGNKKCINLKTNAGHTITVTPDHRIMLEDGSFIEAEKTLNQKIKWGIGNWKTNIIIEEAIVEGFIFGDGFNSGKNKGVSVKLNKNKEKDIYNLLTSFGFNEENCGNLYINKDNLNFNSDFLNNRVYDRYLDDNKMFSDKSYLRSFLIGLYEANGSVNTNSQISLKTTSKKLVEQVQLILSAFGIKSWINVNKPTIIEWPNGIYESRTSYNLQIAPRNAYLFKEKIGFYSDYKNNKIKKLDKEYKTSLIVTDIEYLEEELEVWDFSIPDHHNMANGFVVHNCGEQGLIDTGVCNLVSVNLVKMFDGQTNDINLDKFKNTLVTALRFGDNSIDASDYGLDRINETARTYRNVGVGIMGWADLLIKMKINYDSEEALTLIDKIGQVFEETLNKTSIALGIEKGNAKDCNRRNIAVSSIQPTGTTSMIAGCSSAVEPNFDFVIVRKDESGEHIVNNQIAMEYMEANKTKKLPDYFVRANDIDWKWHINHLKTWQKYIENSISKTINLPNEATKDDIKNSIMEAYNSNIIKAFTVYRDGSRELQVLNKLEDKKEITEDKYKLVEHVSEKRPDRYYGFTEKIPLANGNLYLTINKELGEEDYWNVRDIIQNRGKIVEVFVSYGKSGSDISGYLQAIARLISLNLRKGNGSITIDDVLDSIEGISFSPSWYKTRLIQSPVDAIVKSINRERELREKAISKETKQEQIKKEIVKQKGEYCSICGQEYRYPKGCRSCGCGSKCDQ